MICYWWSHSQFFGSSNEWITCLGSILARYKPFWKNHEDLIERNGTDWCFPANYWPHLKSGEMIGIYIYIIIYIYMYTQDHSLPVFSGPMHVRHEWLKRLLNPKKLRRLAEGKSVFKAGWTVLTINLMTTTSQTIFEKGWIFAIAQWHHIKDLEIHSSNHSLQKYFPFTLVPEYATSKTPYIQRQKPPWLQGQGLGYLTKIPNTMLHRCVRCERCTTPEIVPSSESSNGEWEK